MIKKAAFLLLGVSTVCSAAEQASYDSGGALTSMISGGFELPVHGEFVVKLAGAPATSIQPNEQRSSIVRTGLEPRWAGTASFPNGGQAEFSVAWKESDSGVTLDGSIAAKSPFPGRAAFRFPLDVDTVDYVVDLPRAFFAGGKIGPSGQTLSVTKPVDPVFFRSTAANLDFVDASGNWRLAVALDGPRPVTVTDLWNGSNRCYRLRINLHSGPWMIGDASKIGLTLKLTGTAKAAPATLSVDPTAKLYPFDGFGGNFRIYEDTPVADYALDNLHVAWARFEFKAVAWDHDRRAATPGPQLLRDFGLMQRVQKMGIPWIISLWFLPERFYTDPNQKPFGTFARQIAPDRWPEFLDLLGSYLLYLKSHYGAEPDYFSFNESDLGVNIGFTPESHRDEIKRIGAYLASQGLKTRMLLGDTANPRDSHKFVLAAAADPEAMRYVGAVSFHSWGGGTPAQYEAWGDVGAWLNLPLVVAEAGVDPGAYKNKMYDSYAYGLKEARQFQELLRYARPQAIIYWQFTDDYGLVHVGPNATIEPTGRFWLVKQFANLSPSKSEAVATASDASEVLISAFGKKDALVVHVLNLGPERGATISGLPSGSWRAVVTTESAGYQESELTMGEGAQTLHLPARSLTTLVKE